MVIWINGAFGAGKTQTAFELHRRIENSFVYDPENIGYFLRKNLPPSVERPDDFQDFELWRSLNFSLIRYINENYIGVVIIPMTVVNPAYFDEIVGKLREQGVPVHHFTLMASRETLLKRLKKRGDGGNTWTVRQLDRCLAGLAQEVFKTHIDTEQLTIEEAAEEIARLAGVALPPDQSGKLQRKISRRITQLRHIHWFG
jgi:broad-specificity NMP kinase